MRFKEKYWWLIETWWVFTALIISFIGLYFQKTLPPEEYADSFFNKPLEGVLVLNIAIGIISFFWMNRKDL